MKDEVYSMLGKLEPSAFRRYLHQRGWTQAPSRSGRSHVLRHQYDDCEIEVEIPSSQEYSDYTRRVVEAATTIARFETLTLAELLGALRHPSADILAFRYVSGETEDGTIGIDDSLRIRAARKGLLLSVAHSVVEPSVHFQRLSRSEPVEFLKRCREAPSRVGSFLSEVLVPVSPAVGDLGLEDPFARRVTALLAGALATTSKRLDSGEEKKLLNAASLGISANFLTALSQLRPPGGHGSLHVGFRWAAARPAPQIPTREVHLGAALFEPLEEVARVLRETSEAPGFEISGYVAQLSRAAEDTTKPGSVVMATALEDTPGISKVHVTLPPAQYEQAVEAHRDARQLTLTGTLARRGRKLVLEDPGGLVLEAATPED